MVISYQFVAMLRFRALLAVLLTMTWCSAVMHGGLEAVGLMLEHEHHGHETADNAAHGAHGAATGDHEPVVTRDFAKDHQIRVESSGVLWFALIETLLFFGLSVRPNLAEVKAPPKRQRTDPPLAQVWQFVQRCAPESAAPPVLG